MSIRMLERKKRKIVIDGNFTEYDMERFAKLLREIEKERPSEFFSMVIDLPDLTLEQARDLITKVYKSTIE